MSDAVFDAEVIDAEVTDAVPSDLLREGRFDIGADPRFRYTWFFIIYLGFSMPGAFLAYWGLTLGQGEHFGLHYATVTIWWMATQIPFFLRPVASVVVDKNTGLPGGRRRPWMAMGIIGHIVLLMPLLFIDLGSNTSLWFLVVMVAFIPRVFAEQAIGGLMIEYLPKPGSINATIALAYRVGGNAMALMMAALIGQSLVESYDTVFLATSGILVVGLLGGLGFVLLMREGSILRGPHATQIAQEGGEQRVVADSVAEALEKPELDWPEGTSTWTKLQGALSTKTAVAALVIAFFLPLGDGFEAMFRTFLFQELAWSDARVTNWGFWFGIVTLLGLIGPILSDYRDRRQMLKLYALLSAGCYLALSLSMLLPVPWWVPVALWFPTLVFTDWMMFTFIATWVEISDPRLASTHFSLYQMLQAISATFIMVGLGTLILWVSGEAFWLLFGMATLGPVIGWFMFGFLELDEEKRGTDRFDFDVVSARIQEVLQRIVPTAASMEVADARPRMRIAAALVGVLLLVGVVAASSQLKYTEDVEATEWSAEFNTNMTVAGSYEVLSPGETVSVEIDMQNPGIYLVTWQAIVTSSGGFPPATPQWQVDLYTPASVDITDHGNATEGSWENEGGSTAMVNSTVPSSIDGTDADAVTTKMEKWTQKEGWDWAMGTWIVDLTYTNDGAALPPQRTAECTITLTIEYYEPPGESEYTTNNTTEEQVRSFGLAVGGVLGLPILAGTPVLAWLAGRPPLV